MNARDHNEAMVWSGIGAIALALAVAIGAFGAHGLRGKLDDYSMGIYERAVFYHFVHALGLLVLPLFIRAGVLTQAVGARICVLLLAGIVLFSGSLYALAITGVRVLGAVTPFGGLAFIAAWVMLGWYLLKFA
jgi:uncharacterized membrane protein YgdD (TMEM256/DUF423 family)